MDVKVVRVGWSDPRRIVRAAREAEAERELARQEHARLAKLNRRLKETGTPGQWTCPPACPTCHPTVADDASAGLNVMDLRGAGTRPRLVLSGKRGRCRRCGQRCPKACWYCSDACRYDLARKPPPRFCACGCGQPLPDGASDAKRYLNPTHQKRAARRRQRAARP
jgi:hypothetical protein